MNDEVDDAILKAVLKRTFNCISEDMDGQVLLYRAGTHKAIHLNETAALIWKLCDGSRTIKDVIDELSNVYPDMQTSIAEDVRSGALMLLQEGVLSKTSHAN